jgi:hypothetical protein
MNNFSGGVIKVNSVQYSSPTTSFQVVQGNTNTGTAINLQVDYGIEYSFNHWSDGSTLSSKTFTPSNHTTYTLILPVVQKTVIEIYTISELLVNQLYLIGRSVPILPLHNTKYTAK